MKQKSNHLIRMVALLAMLLVGVNVSADVTKVLNSETHSDEAWKPFDVANANAFADVAVGDQLCFEFATISGINVMYGKWADNKISQECTDVTSSPYYVTIDTQDKVDRLKSNGLAVNPRAAYSITKVSLIYKGIDNSNLSWNGVNTPTSWTANVEKCPYFAPRQFVGVEKKLGWDNPGISFKYTGDFGYLQIRIGDITISNHDWPSTCSWRTKEVNGQKYAWIQFTNEMIDQLKQSGLYITGSKNSGDFTLTGAQIEFSDVNGTREWTAVSSISISGDASGKVGETIPLTASVEPNGASNKTVRWDSSNTDIATVDQNGIVTLVAAGDVTITATAWDDRSKTATKDITVTPNKNISQKPTCGGIHMDQTKLNAGAGVTLSISDGAGTVTTGASSGGYISFNFAEGYNLTELYKWAVGFDDDANKATVDYVAFCKNGEVIKRTSDNKEMLFNYNAAERTLEDQYKAVLVSVDEIRIGFKKNTNNVKIKFFYLDIEHETGKNPTLKAPTDNEMIIAAGDVLKLQITNNHGFWREFTNNTYTTETTVHGVGVNADGTTPDWKPYYEVSGLETGHDYYFGVKDDGNCAIGNHHVSDLVKVHVKVVNGTQDVTCQNNTVSLANLAAYGNTTYNGSGQFTVNGEYSQYGNGLKAVFTNAQNFSNVKTITVRGAEFAGVPFVDTDGGLHWPNNVEAKDGNTVIYLDKKAGFNSIKTIDFREIQPQTWNITSIEVEFDHTPAKPQLINGTTAAMVLPIATGSTTAKNFTLSANSADDTFWREYTAISGTQKYDSIPASEYNTPVREISGLTQGTYYFAAERRRICEFGHTHYSPEITWVTVDVEPQGTMPTELDRIKQPTYGTNHSGMAKEYIAIADLTASNGDHVTGWKDSEGNHITSVTGTAYHDTTDDKESTTTEDDKQKIAYVLGNHAYPVSQTDGLCISKWGRAGLVAGQTEIPTRATIIFRAAGTDDFYVLLKNKLETIAGQPYGHDRRHIKVWYTNDQNIDASGNRKLMPFLCVTNNTTNDFYFYGERGESGLTPLQISVRLQHLGQDGTCNVFVTYEDDAADEMVWVKGIVVKRPDLKVTIGRTDRYGYEADGQTLKAGMHDNVKVTPFGFDKPYQWDFGTAGFYAKTNPNGGDDASNEAKKVNVYDGRTYICGVANGVEVMDHLLVFSDGQAGGDKAQFDGRKKTNGKHAGYEDDETDNNEHIELRHPTKFGTETQNTDNFITNRRAFIPLLSDGIKVNVTGSGWFTIACSAPEAPVKMKVLSSTNGGNAYMNLLREFDIPQTTGSKPETTWETYRVYLKAHVEKTGDNGYWDGEPKKVYDEEEHDITITDPEQTQMSLYVVFESENQNAQLNIHYLQWINELPADYVFQREEDPRLLSTLQSVVSNGTAEKPALYWQAGTSKVEGKVSETIKRTPSSSSTSYPSAFSSKDQNVNVIGQNSGSGSVSESLGCVWDIASVAQTVAHTEKAYWEGKSAYTTEGVNEYDYATAINEDASVSNISREFASPISGSFFRFMPMKNQYIKTHVVPNGKYTNEELKAAEGDTRTAMLKEMKIYIIDETGQPIPFHPGADAREGNKSALDAEARQHGWVAYAQGLEHDNDGNFFYPTFNATTGVPAVRIDIAALAGKEYFLCSNGTKISLARLDASNNNNCIEDLEKTTLTLNNGGTANQSNINTAMSGTGRHIESVTLTGRTFAAGQWASLVLPFSLNEKKLEEVFGEGTQCLHFTEMDKEKNTVYLTHHFYNMVVAGRPVFIKPGSSFTMPTSGNITFNDVTLQANTVTTTQTTNGFTFFASYNDATINKGDLYMNNKNGINYLDITSDTYPGMRSFIQSHGFVPCQAPSTQTQQTKAMFLNFDDTDAEFSTGIESLISAEFGENAIVVTKSTKVYDLNGRVVAAGADINNLPAGMYIVNGKKYVVK